MSKHFWGEFWETLKQCGYYAREIRQEAMALEILRVAGIYEK